MANPVKQAEELNQQLRQIARTARRISIGAPSQRGGFLSAREAADAIARQVKTGLQTRGLT